MSYVAYILETTKILKRDFKSARAAKGCITRHCAATGNDVTEYAVAEYVDYYTKIEKQVTRINLMTGVEYTESVNTPAYMSPSCESYYTM